MKVLSRAFLGEETYISYPHLNSFAFGGRYLVFAELVNQRIEFWIRHLATGTSSRLPDLVPQNPGNQLIWYEVALEANRMAVVHGNRARILDLENPRHWEQVYAAPDSAKLDGLCSLSKDGTKLLLRESAGDTHRAIELNLKMNQTRELFSVGWYANHFHYCPYDENWIAYSHEGPADQILDRCWIWHSEHAPQGRLAFPQTSPGPAGFRLSVGHERWAFHAASAYVPAYAVSPTGPRGLYEIFADGASPRLLWENDVLWHCSMDPTGQFAAVDTTGPFRKEMLSAEEFDFHLARHLETDRTNGHNTSDIVILDLHNNRCLHVATAERTRHPYHPHPAISPDRRNLVWNDSRPVNRGAWIAHISLQ